MIDKRKLKRRHLIYYLRVFDINTDQLIGHLVDITSEGIMLISELPIENHKNFNFRMALPDEILGRYDVFFNAHSVWCREDVNPDFYATGFQIHDLEPEDLIIIDTLVHRYGFND